MSIFERIQLASAVIAIYSVIYYNMNIYLQQEDLFMNPLERNCLAAILSLIGFLLLCIALYILSEALYWITTGKGY